MVQLRIEAARSNELVVVAHFGDRAVGNDDDLVRMLQGGDAVGNDDVRFARAQRMQVLQDLLFRVRIHGGDRIIEDQDLRVTSIVGS